jgi:diadenosine tetraphosphate (Ap4A) HIT family hydrolase
VKLLEDCAFCIDKPGFKSDIPDRTIIESDNFRVFPTLGQIVEGYVLLVPKEHYPCLGAMPEPLLDELILLKEEVDARIIKSYSRPIYFEHGVIGQTVTHAHMHAIPFPEDKDLFEIYHTSFPRYKKLESIKELRDVWKREGVYLYYEINNNKFAFFTHIVPQYARITVANALGVPERANWRTMSRELDEQLIKNTLDKLKKS